MINPSLSFTLIIGDDGTLLVPPNHLASATVLFAKDEATADRNAILAEIESFPKEPIIIAVNTQAQKFKIDTLPPLHFFDRRKVALNRLKQAFGEIELQAYCLNHKDAALLAAIENKGRVHAWIDCLAKIDRTADAVCSLPVESASLICALAPPDDWCLLLTYDKTAGFRQIVTHNGKFAFTRLTSNIALSSSAGLIASTLALEIKATRDYLSRIGLTNNEKLSLFAIVPKKIQGALNATPMNVSSRTILSPHEAAIRLKLPRAPGPDEIMGDIVHGFWLAQKTTLTLPFLTEEMRHKLYNTTIARIGKLATGLLLLVTATVFAFGIGQPFKVRMDTANLGKQIDALERELEAAKSNTAPVTEPMGRLRKAAERHRLFTQETPEVLYLVNALSSTLNERSRIGQFDWSNKTLSFTVSFSNHEEKVAQSEKLLMNIKAAMPDYQILSDCCDKPPLSNEVLSNEARKDDAPDVRFVIQRGQP